MKNKYLVIDAEYEEIIEAVELSDQQLEGMRWLMRNAIENNIILIKIDEPLKFKEI